MPEIAPTFPPTPTKSECQAIVSPFAGTKGSLAISQLAVKAFVEIGGIGWNDHLLPTPFEMRSRLPRSTAQGLGNMQPGGARRMLPHGKEIPPD